MSPALAENNTNLRNLQVSFIRTRGGSVLLSRSRVKDTIFFSPTAKIIQINLIFVLDR